MTTNMKTEVTINSYLSFKLNDEMFAANVSKVLEILGITRITKIPYSPRYMRGVINLRGNVLPVVDSRMKFGMPASEDSVDTCIVVMDIFMEGKPIKIGMLVDSVQEVLEIDDASIEPPPSIGGRYKSEFIQGMVKDEDAFIIILDIDKVLSTDELSLIKDTASENAEPAKHNQKNVSKFAGGRSDKKSK